MKPIIRLDQPLINKIAAGEVVERPLSVVKELFENAIDAGASTITVEIAEGGLTSIRVTDNGVGIPAEQILLAFTRHATSKIASVEDLFEVGTLGFRGEALSSIAAVAQVEMITKTAGAMMGLRTEIHGGEMISSGEIGTVNGTTVIVGNLFYNTPARRKFLKKPGTETGYISDCLQKLALGNTGLTIRYINNGQIVFQTNGRGDLKTTMLSIYGHETAAKLVDITAALDEFELSGLIGKPEIARSNRNRQSFFVNGRLISSKLLTQAVEEATKTMLPGGKFPVYALNLNLPHDTVDVNVHPTKMDVRFADEDGVYRFIIGAVREGLTESNLIPEIRLERVREIPPMPEMEQPEIKPPEPKITPHPRVVNDRPYNTTPPVLPKAEPPSPLSLKEEKSLPSESQPFFTNYTIYGLIFETYWLVTQGQSLYLIDQHAAHERVLYEELLAKSNLGAIPSQSLLAPMPLRLTPMELSLLKESISLFVRFGFEIEVNENGPNKGALLVAVPLMLKGPAPTEFFTDILDKIGETGFSRSGVYAHKTEAIAMAACKAAVKAGDNMSQHEARSLVERMLTLENPFTCPHGRPTIIEITQRELERKFKRG
ncbi:MAG: DNA mismatch repair endonuclease MutL [Defluviitaleaceae bacterium]|nr:DNA mismatch repair endonuclease MutL [Defluviitaleaceae bacterium]